MAAKQFQFSWISMTFGSFEFKIEIMLQVEWEEEQFHYMTRLEYLSKFKLPSYLYANIDFLVIPLTIAAPSIFHEPHQQ